MNESDESRLRDAWRQLPQPEPPRALDRAILDRARQAIQIPVRPRFHLRWGLGAVAASLLCLAMLLPVRESQFAPAPAPDSVDSSASIPPPPPPTSAKLEVATDVSEATSSSTWQDAPPAAAKAPVESLAPQEPDQSLRAPPLAESDLSPNTPMPPAATAPAPASSSERAEVLTTAPSSEPHDRQRGNAKPALKKDAPLSGAIVRLDDPDDVQDQIEALLDAGKRAEAIAMLAGLLQSHPNLRLRASLQPLKAEAMAEPEE